MTLDTSRLLLRELVPEDAAALNEIERDERVTRYMSFDPQTPEQTQEYIESAVRQQKDNPRRTFDLAIVPRGAIELIGRCGLDVRRPEHQEAMLWYELHPAHWGCGHASEAVAALLDFGFGQLNLHRIWADCDPRNAPSCRVVERLGMKLEGRLRENYWLKGEWCSTSLYAILAVEWRSRVGEQRKVG
jgi:RimJ/RimL family protein N-acetyltransferase